MSIPKGCCRSGLKNMDHIVRFGVHSPHWSSIKNARLPKNRKIYTPSCARKSALPTNRYGTTQRKLSNRMSAPSTNTLHELKWVARPLTMRARTRNAVASRVTTVVRRNKSTRTNMPTAPPPTSGMTSTKASVSAGTQGSQSMGSLQFLRQSIHSFLLKPRTLPFPRWVTPRHFSMTLSECIGHASFILVGISYAVDDFLMLRVIAVAGSTCMLFFTYFHPHGRIQWLPWRWNLLFIALNSYRIGKIYWDRFEASQLSPEMKQLREDHLYVIDAVDFAKLINISTEETFQKGDLVVAQGQLNRYVRLVIEGELDAVRDGLRTYVLEEGNFVSESGLHTGMLLPGKVASCCGIVAGSDHSSDISTGPIRVLRWDRSELMELLHIDKSLRRSLKAALSWDVIRKLKGQRQLLIAKTVDNPELWTMKRNEQSADRYASILQNVLHHKDYLATNRDELVKYRMIHHIDDEAHRRALKKCGWTPEEFKMGQKVGTDWDVIDDNEEEIIHDWKWTAATAIRRVFGYSN